MRYEQRKHEILNLLEQKEFIDISELVEKLGVSDITIRRDLGKLETEHLLKRTHGGATKIIEKQLPTFDQKTSLNSAAKIIIGKKAAELIKDGDTIILDCGSTTLQVCNFIKNMNIRVITNSLPVVYALQNSQVTINLIGGELNDNRKAIHGSMAINHINQYHANIAFVGVECIDGTGNLWANSDKEAQTCTAFMAAAERVYILADSTKIGIKGYVKIGALNKNLIHISEIN